MKPEQLKNLSLTELEKLLFLQKKILDFTLQYEQLLLQEGSKNQLEQTRNEALDKLLLLQTEIAKRIS
ncbi:MAG TPA: hypothetical protein DCF33_00680 [Saprospirales bacterium]|nr:hypothetical protein [Saprospirales bacterium]